MSGFPLTARATGLLGVILSGAAVVYHHLNVSTDGGTSWGILNSGRAAIGGATAGDYSQSTAIASDLDLDVGMTYRFAMSVQRFTGTGDATGSVCQLRVEIHNRNSTSSPLDALSAPPVSGGGGFGER